MSLHIKLLSAQCFSLLYVYNLFYIGLCSYLIVFLYFIALKDECIDIHSLMHVSFVQCQ